MSHPPLSSTAIHPPTDDGLVGQELEGRYRILERIGAGGMGEVYRARQLNVDRDVAVKLIHRDQAADAHAVERFENEARIISRLRHPNTLRLFDFGRLADGRLFIVTELLRGMSLADAIAQGPLGERRTATTLRQIAESLHEAHGLGVVHRDLKPHNVFLESVADQEVAKVLDFGIAKLSSQSGNTAAGALVGTPLYMSPEQARGQPADARSDLYSLGVIAYQCLSGRVPFDAETPMGVLFKHMSEPPPELPAELASEPMRRLVKALLAKDPAGRPRSAQDVKVALLELERGPDTASTIDPFARTYVGSAPKRGRRWALAGASVAVFALAALGFFRMRQRPPPASAVATADLPLEQKVFRIPLADSPIRGAHDALVTIIEFGDYQCPYTKLAEPIVQELLQRYPGEVRVVWKDFPLSIHPQAEKAALLAQEAYSEKGSQVFWTVHDRLFDLQPWLEQSALDALEKSQGLTAQHFGTYNPEAARIDQDVRLKMSLGAPSVPVFFVNGRIDIGADHEALTDLVRDELDRARRLKASGVPAERIYDELTRGGVEAIPIPRWPMPALAGVPALGGGPGALPIAFYCDAANPFCAWLQPGLRKVIDRYGDRIRLSYLNVFDPKVPDSVLAAKALAAAYAQRGDAGVWKLLDALSESIRARAFDVAPPLFTRPQLTELSSKLGFDQAAFGAALDGPPPRPVEVPNHDSESGLTRLVIDGWATSASAPHQGLEMLIDRALAERGKR